MKAYLSYVCTKPSNACRQTTFLMSLDCQSHVLATGSPGKGRIKLSVAENLLLEANADLLCKVWPSASSC
jgi:hypothetical protein